MSEHIPVMRDEVVAALAIKPGALYLDATFGRGGYTRAMLAQGAKVIGLDRDPEAVAVGEKLAGENKNFRMLRGTFGELDAHLASAQVDFVDGIAFDIGVSSPQIDTAERGFSFRTDGPLDMRMDPTQGQSAADLVNALPEQELADLIYRYGEERHSRRIAKAIVAARPITRTLQLREVIHSVMRRSPDGIDTATRSFQALRIAVNDELGELERGLEAAKKVLREGGRLVVVSFHSLEDRIVKDFMRRESGRLASPSRHMPLAASTQEPAFHLVGKQPIGPSEMEAKTNPRARSARLRVAERSGGLA